MSSYHYAIIISYRSVLLANIAQQIEESLNQACLALVKRVGELAEELGYSAYLVGGTVRDVLLERQNIDVDLVIAGDAIALTRSLIKDMGGKSKTHPRFGTANLIINNQSIDLVTARSETYANPGALPSTNSTPRLRKMTSLAAPSQILSSSTSSPRR